MSKSLKKIMAARRIKCDPMAIPGVRISRRDRELFETQVLKSAVRTKEVVARLQSRVNQPDRGH